MDARRVVQSCRIERWRGYVASSFYVRLPDGTVLESQPFRWRRGAPPSGHVAARAAYDGLAERLEDLGWTRDADGAEWYASTFARLVEDRDESPPEPEAIPRMQSPPTRIIAASAEHRAEHEPERPVLPSARNVQAPSPPPTESRPVPAAHRRWRRGGAAGAACVVVALVAAFLLRSHIGDHNGAAAGPGTQRQTLPSRPSPIGTATTTSPATTASAQQPVAQAPQPPPAKTSLVDLRIAAHGAGSWLEVRRGSATGAVLYSATLPSGQALHFRGPVLWTRFGAASNLTITVDGRPVRLQGTYDKLFLPAR
jgi:hypothetical protein